MSWLLEYIANMKGPQNFRNKRAVEIVKVLATELGDIDSETVIVDCGAGLGETLIQMVKQWNCKAVGINLYTERSLEVKKSPEAKNITWIYQDVTEGIAASRPNFFGVVTGIYFLQVLKNEQQLLALKEMNKVSSGKIVIIDEISRGGWHSIYDAFVHYGLNLFEKGSRRYNIFYCLFRRDSIHNAQKHRRYCAIHLLKFHQ